MFSEEAPSLGPHFELFPFRLLRANGILEEEAAFFLEANETVASASANVSRLVTYLPRLFVRSVNGGAKKNERKPPLLTICSGPFCKALKRNAEGSILFSHSERMIEH